MIEPTSLHDAEQTLEAAQAKRYAAYPAYRSSEIDWLGDLPEHWDVRRLKFIASTIMGQSPSSDDYTVDEDALPFLQGNAEFGPVNPSARYYCDAATKKAPTGSLLISVRAPVGAVNIADRPYGIGRGLCAVVPDSRLLLPSFTWYALPVTRNELWSIATGSTYEAVSANEVAAMSMPLPPVDEQLTIARFLEEQTKKIDDLIEAKRELLNQLKQKRFALVHNAITAASGRTERLGRVVDRVCRPIDRRDDNEYTAVGLYNWGRGIFHKEPAAGADLGDSDFFWVESGDLILSGQFAWEGAVALAGQSETGCVATHRYHMLRGTTGVIDTSYLYAFFTTNLGQHLLDVNSRGAAGRNRPLNIGMLLKEEIPVPPLEYQAPVSRLVEFETSFITELEASFTLLNEYRTALISAAVTGKIDVRGGAA